jgi:threonine dehydratase
MLPVTVADVQAARGRITAHVRRTPVVPSHWLSEASGAAVMLKLESLQVTSSFKSRGAINAALQLVAAHGRDVTIVTASAGNHGRAIAWAAEQLGIRAIVFTPRLAAVTKTRAIVRHGADLRAVGANYEEAERLAQQHARDTGATFVSPYSHPDVIAGAGTVGLEILDEWPDVDAIVVPVGGGGLISGIALAVRGVSAKARVLGVEVAASCPFTRGIAAGRIVEIDVQPTLADGLAGNLDPDTLTFDIVAREVDEIALVSEAELRDAIAGALRNEALISEGAGAVGVAAVLAGKFDLRGKGVAIVLSGANIDQGTLSTIL